MLETFTWSLNLHGLIFPPSFFAYGIALQRKTMFGIMSVNVRHEATYWIEHCSSCWSRPQGGTKVSTPLACIEKTADYVVRRLG